jgi:phosphoglycerol transferase MdoB-like AlkP superfamily enzyme
LTRDKFAIGAQMSEVRAQTRHAYWLRPFLFTIAVCLGVSGVSRVLLLLWLQHRIADTGGTGFVLAQGLRFDLVTLGILLAVPMTMTPIVSLLDALRGAWFRVLRWYLVLLIGLFVFMEVATPSFIMEYDVRPNILFIEYLKYPKELLSMLFVGYKRDLAAVALLVPAITWPAYRYVRALTTGMPRSSLRSAFPLALLALLVCLGAARSTLDHRPVNPSTVAFSTDTLVNSLPLNSLYCVMYAVYGLQHEDEGFAYGHIDEAAALRSVREVMRLDDSAFVDSGIPNLHFQAPTVPAEKPLNLVFVVEESLGAEYVGSLGGLPLTPNLDRLADDGIWFEQLYATGTRSARGLEAIVAGFPPTTSQSVLKLGLAQQDFFTLGEYLRRKGYATSFIYGGEAQFDNMQGFFANNGFETVFDKHDFVNPVFYGSWGASDEDVFRYADEVFSAYPTDKPFFCVLFTTSNHTPWEFPDGRIELYEQPKATVHNAVKYADYALGEFFRTAKASSYWDNTIFIVVADHNSRVHGVELVPIEYFHIPGLILGGSISPRRWDRVASQIDLLPTALSLIGVSGAHPAPGFDLTRPDIDQLPERAVMQYGDTQAYREGDRVVIQRRERPAGVYLYRDNKLAPAEDDPALRARALAMAAWPVLTYREQQYRLP